MPTTQLVDFSATRHRRGSPSAARAPPTDPDAFALPERLAYACRAYAFSALRRLGFGSIRLCTRSLALARRLTHGSGPEPMSVGRGRHLPRARAHPHVPRVTHRVPSASCSSEAPNYVKSLISYLNNRAGVIGYASDCRRSLPRICCVPSRRERRVHRASWCCWPTRRCGARGCAMRSRRSRRRSAAATLRSRASACASGAKEH